MARNQSFRMPRLSCACAFGLLLAAVSSAWGQAALPSRISILVGFGPAQGNDQPARPDASTLAANRMSPDMSYDQTARFLARHLGRFLPGHPVTQAQHVPGGAGLVAARAILNARPDGGVIALLSSNVIYGAALKLPGADVPVDRFVWLGGVAPDAWTCIRTQSSHAKPIPWAGSLGVGSRSDAQARALRDHAGYPMEIASGYVSRFELVRALENGEIDMACGWPISDLDRRRREWLDTGKMEIVGMFSRARAGGFDGKQSQPADALAVLSALAAEAELAWPLAGPPGLDPAVAGALRDALEQISHSTEAIEDAQRAGITLDLVDAATIDNQVRRLHALDADVRTRLRSLFSIQR